MPNLAKHPPPPPRFRRLYLASENTRTRHIFVIKYIKKRNVFKMCLYIMLIVEILSVNLFFP